MTGNCCSSPGIADSGKHRLRTAWQVIVWQVIVGLLVTAILIGLKIYIESHEGYRFEIPALEYLQSRLSPFEADKKLPILVVDISDLEGPPTPRDKLTDLIKAIAEYGPSAIGVDIDFSPNETGLREDDPKFFKECLAITEKTGVPIFLGTYRTSRDAPDFWLGSKKYKELAASIDIPQEEGTNKYTTRMPLSIKPKHIADAPKLLPSMGFALARAYLNRENVPEPQPLPFLRRALEIPSEHEPGTSVLVNYSKLEQMQHEAIATSTPSSVNEFRRYFPHRMIILGNATEAKDRFTAPGHDSPAGVYAHASTAYAVGIAPLFEFKYETRLVLDLLISGLIIFLSSTMSSKLEWKSAPLFVSMMVVVLALWLVQSTRIIWADFILVIFFLLLHHPFEAWLGPKLEWWDKPREKTS